MTNKISAMLDTIADTLESLGRTKEAFKIDMIANTINAGVVMCPDCKHEQETALNPKKDLIKCPKCGEFMYNKISSMLDNIADKLESKGLKKEALTLDKIANTLDQAEATKIVAQLPDDPAKAEKYLMSLGNSRVEILARKLFRPLIGAVEPFLGGPKSYETTVVMNGKEYPYKDVWKAYKEHFVKGL